MGCQVVVVVVVTLLIIVVQECNSSGSCSGAAAEETLCRSQTANLAPSVVLHQRDKHSSMLLSDAHSAIFSPEKHVCTKGSRKTLLQYCTELQETSGLHTLSTCDCLLHSPGLSVLNIVKAKNRIVFHPLQRHTFFKTNFLGLDTVKHVAPGTRHCRYSASLQEFEQISQECMSRSDNQTLHFMFHSAHCGSTLLTRALGALSALPLREPSLLLHTTQNFFQTRDQLRQATLIRQMALWLGRRYNSQQIPLVKAHDIWLMQPVLRHLQNTRSVFMYNGLQTHCIQYARHYDDHYESEDLWFSLLEVHHQGMRDFFKEYDHQEDEFKKLGHMEVDALNWVKRMVYFVETTELYPLSMMGVHFNDLLKNPQQVLSSVSTFFNQNKSAEEIAEVVNGVVFKSYSKVLNNVQPFDANNRNKALVQGLLAYPDDVKECVSFGKSLLIKLKDRGASPTLISLLTNLLDK